MLLLVVVESVQGFNDGSGVQEIGWLVVLAIWGKIMESCMEIDVYQNQKLLIVSDTATNANVGKQVMKNLGALVAI